MLTSLPKPSPKLAGYLNWIEHETQAPIELELVPNVGLPGIKAGFRVGHSNIRVEIVMPFDGSQDELEQCVAHEATHGLLVFGRGYVEPRPTRQLTQAEATAISTIGTMLDDVVVNTIIQQHGFAAFTEVYPRMVRRETLAARSRSELFYSNAGPERTTRERFMIYRFVQAWLHLKYIKVSLDFAKSLKKFRSAFRAAYPALAARGDAVQQLFEKYDVFSADGHEHIMSLVTSEWGLGGIVNLEKRDRGPERQDQVFINLDGC